MIFSLFIVIFVFFSKIRILTSTKCIPVIRISTYIIVIYLIKSFIVIIKYIKSNINFFHSFFSIVFITVIYIRMIYFR